MKAISITNLRAHGNSKTASNLLNFRESLHFSSLEKQKPFPTDLAQRAAAYRQIFQSNDSTSLREECVMEMEWNLKGFLQKLWDEINIDIELDVDVQLRRQ